MNLIINLFIVLVLGKLAYKYSFYFYDAGYTLGAGIIVFILYLIYSVIRG